MNRTLALVAVASTAAGFTLAMQACSGDNSSTSDAGDSSTADVTTQDVSTHDAATNDASNDVATNDASDGGCPATWTDLPTIPTDAGILLPPDGGALPPVLLHFAGSGTQDYMCEASINTSTYAWTLTGPTATLADCHGNVVGDHFASDGGAKFPEWMTTADQSFVVGEKENNGYQPDPTAVAWLLLPEFNVGGAGTISQTVWVQRLFTTGGVAPATGCATSGDVGMTTTVAYTADYYFYGN
jgi:hypothetical protein